MRRMIASLSAAAVLVAAGAAALQLHVDETAGPATDQVINASLDNPHAERPAAAPFLQLASVTRHADEPTSTPPGEPTTTTAAPVPEDPQQAAALALWSSYAAALQAAQLRTFYTGLYVWDGFSRNGAFLSCVRNRESHGNYRVISRSGAYFGAYQFAQSTWNNTALHSGRSDLVGWRPSDVEPLDQDAMAVHLLDWQGRAPWGSGCR